MTNMENAEEVMQILDRFTRLKQKEIPKELDEYLQYVAKTGDTVFKWSSLKYLFREKLLNVIKHFHDTTPRVDEIPQYPNVDPFNYESMKSSLLERLELFNAAPFTIQRLCELLIDPRKQYSRLDKFMRALEKNILVSTIEPGRKRTESENGDSLDSVVNGDLSLDVNVDIDMENESLFNMETQNGNGTAAAETATKEKSSTEKPNASHRLDEEYLPNPKKAKLDLDEKEEKETEVPTKAATETNAEPEISVKVKPDAALGVQQVEKETEKSDKQKAQDENAPNESEKKDDVVIEKELTKEDEKEKETVEEKKDAEKEVEENKLTEEKEEQTEKSNSNGVATDEQTEKSDKSNEASKEDEEKIIEKQEIENKEKPSTTAEKNEVEVDVADTVVAAEKHEEKKDEKQDPKEDNSAEKEKMDSEKAEASVDETAKEAKEEDDLAAKVEEKDSKASEAVETGGAAKEVVTEKEAVKCQDAKSSEDSKKITETPITESKKTDVQPEKDVKVKESEDTAAAADAIVAEVGAETDKQPSSTAEVAATVATVATEDVAPIEEDLPEETADLKPDKTEETTTEAIVTEAAVVMPSLALNDQPMEDLPLEEMTPAVEEVVMAESGSAIEMATDAIEIAKDEPAGMEVDDTSQEAMDQ